MSTVIRPLPGERRVSYSSAWFAPVDEVTGAPPALPLRALLDIYDGQGWVPTGIAATTTLSGAIGYPGLGRCRNPVATAPIRYRVRFASQAYLPISRAQRDGEEFLAYPFDDTTPPAVAASRVAVSLAPAMGYPFPGDVPVLYGQVTGTAGEARPGRPGQRHRRTPGAADVADRADAHRRGRHLRSADALDPGRPGRHGDGHRLPPNTEPDRPAIGPAA